LLRLSSFGARPIRINAHMKYEHRKTEKSNKTFSTDAAEAGNCPLAASRAS
jgi:hypothetical protein